MKRRVQVHRDRRGFWRAYCPCCPSLLTVYGCSRYRDALFCALDHIKWGHRR